MRRRQYDQASTRTQPGGRPRNLRPILLDMLQESERRTEPASSEISFDLTDKKVIEQLKARWGGKT